jgi:hypothetical protein
MWKNNQLQGQYFGLWFMVIVIVWGFIAIIVNVDVIVIISIAPLFCL